MVLFVVSVTVFDFEVRCLYLSVVGWEVFAGMSGRWGGRLGFGLV